MNPLICNNLIANFGGLRALGGVDLQLQSGEFLGVSGANAAGKTSLLNAICGLIPAEGHVRVLGRCMDRLSSHKRARAGIVRSFENGSICDRMSTVDNVAIALWMLPLRRARSRAEWWLRALDAPVLKRIRGAEISMGQKRRVELARVFSQIEAHDGKAVVLLDEPLRGLDTASKEAACDLLNTYVRGKIPTIMVEHDTESTERLATRVIWMDSGRICPAAPSKPSQPLFDAVTQPSTASELAISLDQLHTGYGPVEVLHGVSLDVHVGENIQIVGNNGSGKSTMLRAIMGVLAPWSGQVKILGCLLVGALARTTIGIGYAPQGGRLICRLAVRDHLRFCQQVARRRGSAEVMGPAFLEAFPELGFLLSTAAGDLSSGQRSLVAMAMAMATEPSILIADEPATGLSPALFLRLRRFLAERWCHPTRTMVLIEHVRFSLPNARVVRLERGAIVG